MTTQFYQPPFQMNPAMMGGAPFSSFQPKALAPALYVGDLDENVQEETLYDFFQSYGNIHFVRIMRDNQTGKSRGYAFVNFVNPRDAETAKQMAQYAKLGNKCIRIMFKRNIKEMPTDANIYVKNIDPSASMKDLHNHFSQATNHSGAPIGVVSVKIAFDSEGKSLGYGYVQFEKAEDAKFAIENMNGSKLKENDLELHEFVPRDKRISATAKRNLYIKNLPSTGTEEEVNESVKAIFGQYGEIESMKCSNRNGKWAAFVCYKSADDAAKSIKAIADQHLKLDGENDLFVGYHQSKAIRQRELQKEHAQTQNETNLYVKNLRTDVKESEVRAAFQQFGEITSVAVKEWKSQTGQKVAKFGFIAFKNAQDAKDAVANALNNSAVVALYLASEPRYINLHQPKERRNEFIHSKKRLKMQMFQFPQAMDPYRMMMQPPMNRRFAPVPGPNQFMKPQQMGQRGGYGNRGGHQQMNKGPGQNRGPNKPGQGGMQQGGQRGGMQNRQNNNQQKPQQNVKPQEKPQQKAETTPAVTVQQLRSKLTDFLALDQNRQRHILGELLFPKIRQKVDEQMAPKITGMLIDLSVLEVTDILEFLEDESILNERIQEAKEVILEGEQ